METAITPTAVVTTDDGRRASGLMTLAAMSGEEFERRLEQLKAGQDRIKRLHQSLMVPDVDYGVIPGTQKPTLLKPGAEKLAHFYGLVAEFRNDIRFGDGEDEPHVTVLSECILHSCDALGPVVGSGSGACSTWESKYRYRNAERACPSCGCVGTIRKSKFEDRQTGLKGWYCHDKAGGCGAQFKPDDPGIVDQHPGRTQNADAAELLNTVLKMASKRAHMDAILRTTCTSGLYTQDLDDTAPAPMGSRQQQRPATAPEDVPTVQDAPRECAICKAAMTASQVTMSMRKHGRPLCPPHQKNPDAAEPQAETKIEPKPATNGNGAATQPGVLIPVPVPEPAPARQGDPWDDDEDQ